MKSGYSVQVTGYYGVKVLWEVLDNYVVEKTNDNYDIGLLGLYIFDEDK